MADIMREMSLDECRTALGVGVVGRVAVATPNGPHIVPVNYWMVDRAVILRTTAYSVLGRYGHDAVVALEVDSIDPATASGWSVVARGRAEAVTHAEEIAALRDRIETEPWAPGSRPLYLRIAYAELTGRTLRTSAQEAEKLDGVG